MVNCCCNAEFNIGAPGCNVVDGTGCYGVCGNF